MTPRPRRRRLLEALSVFGIGAALGAGIWIARNPGPGDPTPDAETAAPAEPYVDEAALRGLSFRHRNGATGERYFPETMGAGVVVFDYDGDGDPDILLTQSGPLPLPERGGPGADARLFRNDGGRLTDVTEAAGLAGNGAGGYGMGGCAADIDGDGHPDLYLTRFGPDRFYRSRGDGTFEDATDAAGLATPGWSTSACFLDYDQDGRLDLYVARYVDLEPDLSNHRPCVQAGHRSYCSPLDYGPLRDRLYRNVGGGRFEDATEAAGILDDPTGYGLGVVSADLDADGRPDLYVANDLGDNRLYLGGEGGIFREAGLEAGVALGESGRQQAGMGLEVGDLDGDGRLDLVCTNYQHEVNDLYLSRGAPGEPFFIEASIATGFGRPSEPYLGFGVALVDPLETGRLGALVANGHVMDNVARWDETASFPQRLLLLTHATAGAAARDLPRFDARPLADARVWRGLAAADLDRDGDLDLVCAVNDGPPALLIRPGAPARGWLRLRLVGAGENREAVGARADVIRSDGVRAARVVTAGSSYLSQSELPLTFNGLRVEGERGGSATVEVRWPSGRLERHERVALDRAYTLVEGEAPR